MPGSTASQDFVFVCGTPAYQYALMAQTGTSNSYATIKSPQAQYTASSIDASYTVEKVDISGSNYNMGILENIARSNSVLSGKVSQDVLVDSSAMNWRYFTTYASGTAYFLFKEV
jgi:hypothetical protein